MPDNKKGGRTKSRGGKVVPNPSFDRLKKLKCFNEAHQRIVDGWPLTDLARWIQEHEEEYTDITKEGLIAILSKYRAAIPVGDLKTTEEMPSFLAKKIDEAEDSLDEISALNQLYKIQMKRIEMDHKLENQIGKSLNTLGQELRVAREIIAESAKLKMELGLKKRDLGTINVGGEVNVAHTHTEIDNPAVKKLLDNPQARRRLLGIAKNMLKSAGTVTVSDLETADTAADEVIDAELAELEGSDE
jgi:transcriptional regulator of heat shock response